MKYLFIFEDGSLSQGNEIPTEIMLAFDDGLYDIVDMKTGKQFSGDKNWYDIEELI